MVNLSALAFAVRQALAAQGYQLSIGHTQQLVAAALGHDNLASYQSSGDDRELHDASDIVIDSERLKRRASELGHVGAEFAGPLAEAVSQRIGDAVVHGDVESYLIALQEFVDERATLDDAVNSEVAMTNGTFPIAELELPLWHAFDTGSAEDIDVALSGLVTVTQDEERVYWGHEVEVDASLHVERWGRMLFGGPRLRVQRAKLRWMGESSDSTEDHAQAMLDS